MLAGTVHNFVFVYAPSFVERKRNKASHTLIGIYPIVWSKYRNMFAVVRALVSPLGALAKSIYSRTW